MNFEEFVMKIIDEANEDRSKQYDAILKDLKIPKDDKKKEEKDKQREEKKAMKLYCIIPEHVNLKEIDDAIMHKTSPQYLIMSQKTFNTVFPTFAKNSGTYSAYHGIPVAICDALEYGVFEVI